MCAITCNNRHNPVILIRAVQKLEVCMNTPDECIKSKTS